MGEFETSLKQIGFNDLETADLVVDAVYEGGTFGDIRDDPISKLMNCGNQGGFRIVGDSLSSKYKFAALYSSLDDPDWPDNLDLENGLLFYYGDNKTPGHKLHDTPKKGNLLLSRSFAAIHSSPYKRKVVPPFFVFTKSGKGRDVIFRGLAAPGSRIFKPIDDLVAVWKNTGGKRFQNYRACFTILNAQVIKRSWINDLLDGNPLSASCPETWRSWVETGDYNALKAEPTIAFRKKAEQLPSSQNNRRMIDCIHKYFKDDAFGFEHCAAKIVSLMDENVVNYNVTRPWRDGGRDATGQYRIGSKGDNIKVDFAIEAKCFEPGKALGVKHTSRLISRLKHRQFGILVTTSYVGEQAYSEIREDGHPVIVISAEDIANILTDAGIGTAKDVSEWLRNNFPRS